MPSAMWNINVHLTSLTITEENAWGISKQGRLRWKIENEGFNTQKNHGFTLGHKFARKNFNAIKNYCHPSKFRMIFWVLKKVQ